MAELRAIRIERGPSGFGGPLTIVPTEKRNKVMVITGGGAEPECLAKIVELSGMTPVNGFKTSCPEDELAMVIVDCGGTLRCGLYPKKGIPTANVMPTGKSGPMAQYIKEDIYVSAVGPNQVSLADPSAAAAAAEAAEPAAEEEKKSDGVKYTGDLSISKTLAQQEKKSFITSLGLGVGKVVNTFYQAARDAIQTCIITLLPFMAFVSMLVGIINGSGIGTVFAKLMQPLAGNIVGLLILGIICSIPGLSALLGPGAVIAQIIGTLIGDQTVRHVLPFPDRLDPCPDRLLRQLRPLLIESITTTAVLHGSSHGGRYRLKKSRSIHTAGRIPRFVSAFRIKKQHRELNHREK